MNVAVEASKRLRIAAACRIGGAASAIASQRGIRCCMERDGTPTRPLPLPLPNDRDDERADAAIGPWAAFRVSVK